MENRDQAHGDRQAEGFLHGPGDQLRRRRGARQPGLLILEGDRVPDLRFTEDPGEDEGESARREPREHPAHQQRSH